MLEFPEEKLTVSNHRLFCTACRETLSLKRSTVQNHVRSVKHMDSKKRMKERVDREMDIVRALKKYDDGNHSKGETLSDEQRVYRIRVVTTFLRAGVPMSKLDIFRDILEEGAYRLTDKSHMLELVPFILHEERSRIKQEIAGKCISVIFDGTTRLGEVLAVIVRFVCNWKIEQRLIRLEFLSKSMSGEEIARELISTLSVCMGIAPSFLLATMRDKASVNNLAMRTISVIYPNAIDIGCCSHALDHVGEKFHTPTLNTFSSLWIMLFSHSPKSKVLWKEQTGMSIITYSKTRWWSRWEVLHQLMIQFGDLLPFFTNNTDIGPSIRPKVIEILTNLQQRALLQIELAAVIDLGEHFIKATYHIEGDCALILEAYEIIQQLSAVIHTANYPNLNAVAKSLSPTNVSQQQQWIQYGMECLQPGIKYFKDQFGDDNKSPVSIFKAARYFNPTKISELQPTAAEIGCVDAFTFLDLTTISSLKLELPLYLAKARDISEKCDPFEWWKRYEVELPTWSKAVRNVLLVQPSSAAAECAFSLLNNSFNRRQFNSLEDYVEASIMLQYNKR